MMMDRLDELTERLSVMQGSAGADRCRGQPHDPKLNLNTGKAHHTAMTPMNLNTHLLMNNMRVRGHRRGLRVLKGQENRVHRTVTRQHAAQDVANKTEKHDKHKVLTRKTKTQDVTPTACCVHKLKKLLVVGRCVNSRLWLHPVLGLFGLKNVSNFAVTLRRSQVEVLKEFTINGGGFAALPSWAACPQQPQTRQEAWRKETHERRAYGGASVVQEGQELHLDCSTIGTHSQFCSAMGTPQDRCHSKEGTPSHCRPSRGPQILCESTICVSPTGKGSFPESCHW